MDEEIQKYINPQGGVPTAFATTYITALPPGAVGATDLKVCLDALPYLN